MGSPWNGYRILTVILLFMAISGSACQTHRPTAGELSAKMPAVVAELDSPNDEVRSQACEKLNMRDPEVAKLAMPHLIRLLKSENRYVPEAAAYLLSEAGPTAAPAVPALVEVLGDRRASVREKAAFAIPRIGQGRKEAIPALVKALDDEDPWVRLRAAEGLGVFGADAAPAVPGLIAMLDAERFGDGSFPIWQHHDAAARTLGRIGPAAGDAVPVLIRRCRGQARECFIFALGRMGSAAKDAVPVIAAALEAGPREVALNALGNIGQDAASAIPAITKRIDDPQSWKPALQALTKIGPAAVPALVEVLGNPDPERRAYGAIALGRMGPPAKAALPSLEAMREDAAKGGPEFCSGVMPYTVGQWAAYAIDCISGREPKKDLLP